MESKTREKRSAWFWGLFVMALFGINLTIAVMAIVLASGDPSFGPMPGYGDHGVDWQTRKEQLQRSADMQWRVVATRIPSRDGLPCHGLQLDVADRDGTPIVGCQGNVRLYHFAHIRGLTRVGLSEVVDHPGRYVAAVDVSRPGKWQVELSLTRGEGLEYFADQTYDWFDSAALNEVPHD